jgi:hypothetical protein
MSDLANQMFAAGASLTAVAAATGFTRGKVSGLRHRWRAVHAPQPVLPIREVLRARLAGVTCKALAQLYGTTSQYVGKALRKWTLEDAVAVAPSWVWRSNAVTYIRIALARDEIDAARHVRALQRRPAAATSHPMVRP